MSTEHDIITVTHLYIDEEYISPFNTLSYKEFKPETRKETKEYLHKITTGE